MLYKLCVSFVLYSKSKKDLAEVKGGDYQHEKGGDIWDYENHRDVIFIISMSMFTFP